MKKLLLAMLSVMSVVMTDCTQPVPSPQTERKEQWQEAVPYKLVPTSNIWTFIKLDTRNGRMWQLQYSISGDEYRCEVPLNITSLSTDTLTAGRFELYPTQNMYNFILLDGINGKSWQVQWSKDENNRLIIPIQPIATNL